MSETKNKKPSSYLDELEYEEISESLCCQMLHLGSYDTEPKDFEMMNQFCKDSNYKRISYKHREIYLSDPRRTEPQKLKTV